MTYHGDRLCVMTGGMRAPRFKFNPQVFALPTEFAPQESKRTRELLQALLSSEDAPLCNMLNTGVRRLDMLAFTSTPAEQVDMKRQSGKFGPYSYDHSHTQGSSQVYKAPQSAYSRFVRCKTVWENSESWSQRTQAGSFCLRVCFYNTTVNTSLPYPAYWGEWGLRRYVLDTWKIVARRLT